MTTNLYINDILEPLSSIFKGTYSANTLPQNLKNVSRFSLVCNLSNVNEVGSHFITIIRFKNYVLYIDSLGLPCFNDFINTFLASLQIPIYYNNVQIQDEQSLFCSFYAIFFILYFEKKQVIKMKFYKPPSPLLIRNDKKVVQYIVKLIKCMQ